MMLEESSTLRSVTSVVICGVVTRMMTKPKNPTSARVTATIAASLDAPRPFRNPAKPCTNQPLRFGVDSRLGKICPWDGFNMVNGG